jgi:hypothetical protein
MKKGSLPAGTSFLRSQYQVPASTGARSGRAARTSL